MLLDKIRICTSTMNELSTLRQNALSIGAFESAVNSLTTAQAIISDFVDTAEEMKKVDFCQITLSDEDIDTLKASIRTCALSLQQMSLTKNEVQTLLSSFDTKKKLLAMVWTINAKAKVDPIRSYLGVIQMFVPQKDEVSNLIKALGTGSAAEPSAAIVKTLVINIDKANAITSSFTMSESVRGFMQKVKLGKATFSDITPDVEKWIKEHRLASRIKISF